MMSFFLNPWTMVAGAILVLTGVMLVACIWPAVRAMGIQPTITLRYQE